MRNLLVSASSSAIPRSTWSESMKGTAFLDFSLSAGTESADVDLLIRGNSYLSPDLLSSLELMAQSLVIS